MPIVAKKITISLPSDVEEYLRDRFYSKVQGRTAYGAISKHITDLILADKARIQFISSLTEDN